MSASSGRCPVDLLRNGPSRPRLACGFGVAIPWVDCGSGQLQSPGSALSRHAPSSQSPGVVGGGAAAAAGDGTGAQRQRFTLPTPGRGGGGCGGGAPLVPGRLAGPSHAHALPWTGRRAAGVAGRGTERDVKATACDSSVHRRATRAVRAWRSCPRLPQRQCALALPHALPGPRRRRGSSRRAPGVGREKGQVAGCGGEGKGGVTGGAGFPQIEMANNRNGAGDSC